jgi:hypothetical protein
VVSEDLEHLCRNAPARHQALFSIGDAIVAEDLIRLAAEIATFDAAIVASLGSMGFPRGPVARVSVEELGYDLHGLKRASCEIVLGRSHLIQSLSRRGNPDAVFKTWLHESLHARAPFSHNREPMAEYRPHPGYEEGLVDGLVRVIGLNLAGLSFASEYEDYVMAYERLANALEITPISLWRALWRYPFGEVREALCDEVEHVWYTRRRATASRDRFQRVADQVFARFGRLPRFTEADLDALWSEALRG